MGCSLDFAAMGVATLFGVVAGFPLLLLVFAARKPRQRQDPPRIIDSTCEVKR